MSFLQPDAVRKAAAWLAGLGAWLASASHARACCSLSWHRDSNYIFVLVFASAVVISLKIWQSRGKGGDRDDDDSHTR